MKAAWGEGIGPDCVRREKLGPGGHQGHIIPAGKRLVGGNFIKARYMLLRLAAKTLAITENRAEGTAGDVRAIVAQQAQKIFHMIGGYIVVRVHEADVLAPGQLHSLIPGVGQTAVCLVKDLNTMVLFRPAVAHSGAGVRRAVVHKDDLDILIALGQKAFHASVQESLHLVDRNDNGNERVFCQGCRHSFLLIRMA